MMTDALPKAWGGVAGVGTIKACTDDFVVIEELNFTPDAGGEHLWLYIEKRNWNTEDVACWLARAAGVHRLAVGYSGLKDKRALTRQWFSLQLPGKPDPDFDWPEGISCLEAMRHKRKLNRGTHRHNRFALNVTGLDADRDRLDANLEQIARFGVPNYFGKQRMGHVNSNLTHAMAWLGGTGEAPRKRKFRSFWLSAMRSQLFNLILAERVTQGCWDSLLEGDILQPVGSRGLFFAVDEPHAAERLAALEVHPTAPLPGRVDIQPTGKALALEAAVLAPFAAQLNGLEAAGVEGARRATRLIVESLEWHYKNDNLELTFRLPTGAFATTLLAELIGEGGESK